MPIYFDLSKYPNKYFIETGTYQGDGIEKALKTEKFQYIYSIELDTLRHIVNKEKYGIYDNVTLIKGDSGKLLKLILKHIDVPCTFWLDAHFCADDAEYGDKWSPIIEELEAIKNHPIKNHTILIDDYRCMDNMHFDKERNIPIGFPGKKKLLEMLQEINPDYRITFLKGAVKNDVVLARVDYEFICKDVLDNIINKIENREKIKEEGEMISKNIIENLISNIDKIVQKKNEIKQKSKEEMINKDFKIIENKLHEYDEMLNQKEEKLIQFETKLKNKEFDLMCKEETIKEIIIDMELRKEVSQYEKLEEKILRSTKRGKHKKRKRQTK